MLEKRKGTKPKPKIIKKSVEPSRTKKRKKNRRAESRVHQDGTGFEQTDRGSAHGQTQTTRESVKDDRQKSGSSERRSSATGKIKAEVIDCRDP